MSHYIFSGHDTVTLAKEYGTPLYVMSEDILRDNIQGIKDAFEKTGAEYEINFAGKSFLNLAMCRIVDEMGICLDVASGGELYTALQSGFDPSRLCLHGNNKSREELEMALDARVGRIVIDNAVELDTLDQLTRDREQHITVLFRVTPGISAHTHELIQTATEDSKFGVPIRQARGVIGNARKMPFIDVVGIHCHVGSQIIDDAPFVMAMDIMMDLYKVLQEDGLDLKEINLGGGFGIPYLTGDESFDVMNHIPRMVAHIREMSVKKALAMPRLVVEPGRYISATAGITLYTVGTVKDIPGVKKYVCIDGGMADNPRPALYDAEYEALLCNHYGEASTETVTISGKACETDRLIASAKLPSAAPGDILAVRHTGAYNYSMSSNYNRLRRPAVVLLRGVQSGIIVERETYADLIAHDRIVPWLEK
ncbi:MAG: diaminopimelate decarboxylase [Eubacterium sp.]